VPTTCLPRGLPGWPCQQGALDMHARKNLCPSLLCQRFAHCGGHDFFLVHKKRIVLVLVMWSHSRALLVLSTLFLIALSRPIGVRTSPTVEAMMPMIPSAITANGSDPGLNSSAGNRPHCGLPTTCLLRHFGLPVRRCLLTTPICGNGSNCQGAETCEWALPQAAVPTIWLRRS
jgi:hypothetical protein